MNEIETNLLTAIQMYLYQVDRKNKSHGGNDRLNNLITLCLQCHIIGVHGGNLILDILEVLEQDVKVNGVDIHSADYKTNVEEQAMGMFKLVEDIVSGGTDAPETI